MVIRCDHCETLFRIDRTLIAGYRAARIRCRRCGRSIAVTIPTVPPPASFPAGERTNPIGSSGAGRNRLFEEPFRWSGIPPAKRFSILAAIKTIVQFAALWTTVGFLGFYLFRAILSGSYG
jgi:predicted Zn finger-like uncharacterized protein